MFNNIDILITSNDNKTYLLKNNKELLTTKFYSLKEFLDLYYFTYNEETIYYVMNKYNVIYDIALIYLNNLYYIENKLYKSSKLNFLSDLKSNLLKENLLHFNQLFKSSLKNKKILFYNVAITKELKSLIDSLNADNIVEVKYDNNESYKHNIIELNTIEDEVVYVANSICNLIKKGINITNIYLTNLTDDYRKIIKRIFPMFNIPFTLNDEESIYTTFIGTTFMNNYHEDISETLDILKQYITSVESQNIYNKIIDIINKYIFVTDKTKLKEIIKYELMHTKLKKDINTMSVLEVDLKETIFKDDDYVFVMSFNQGIIPITYKDEEFLSDKEKEELGISLTIDKNLIEKKIITDKLNSIKNLIITYKLKNEGEEFNLTSLNDNLKYEVIKSTNDLYNNSNLYNKIKLTSLLDDYNKYGTKNDLLYTLNNHYKIPYNTYDNRFKGLNKDSLHMFIDNKLMLSYTSLDKYYRCPFSFYINNILKLDIYEETFPQLVGNIFHHILEKITIANISFDELWSNEIMTLEDRLSFKEKFFLKKLKEELRFIVDTIKEQENYTNLHNELHEERIYTNIEGNIKITFTGVIDKIKYTEVDGETIIAIIDYKTGNINLDLNTIPYGIGMQLPVYLYLAKHSSKLKKIKVAGFYLQKILNNEISVDKTHTYEQQKKNNLLLQGYSNSNMDILKEFDNTYTDSNLIKSMKVTKNNDFYHYSKVLENREMDRLVKIVEDKIKEASAKISNAEFDIAPKKIDKNNYGCEYCKYNDICFHTAKDVQELKKLIDEDLKEILGGD